MEKTYTKLACLASETEPAQKALKSLREKYDFVSPDAAEALVIIGGDGFMLQAFHDYADRDVAIYGMNRGSVGFLLNPYHEDDLPGRLARAKSQRLHPLRMETVGESGERREALAFNEVSLMRQTYQTAALNVSVNGRLRLERLMADGIMVATPAGSTAYNLSVRGPILPVGSSLLALTPISPFRPRRWDGALLPNTSSITFTILETDKRPVSATADSTEVRHVREVHVTEDRSTGVDVLFDNDNTLEDRVFGEQFTTH